MDYNDLQVKVPYWARHIKHEGVLTLLAFMHRMHLIYGDGEFTMQNSDINLIIGSVGMNHDMFIYKLCPEAKDYVKLKWTANGWSIIELKPMRSGGSNAGVKTTELVTIKDERQIRVWCFLLGAFRNHLITDNPFTAKKRATMFNADQNLFKYSPYESDSK